MKSSSKKTSKPKSSGRGGKRENAGRPKTGKVKLSAWVLPEIKAALGARPGERIDSLVSSAQ